MKKKILIVDEFFHPYIGGMQIRTRNFIDKWLVEGCDISVVVIDHLGGLPKYEILSDVKVYRLIHDSKYYKRGIFGRRISTIFKFTYKFIQFLNNNNNNFDVVIFNQFPILPAIAMPFFRKRNGAITVLDFVEYRDGFLWKLIQNRLFRSVDKVVAISDYILEKVQEINSDCKLVPNSVDESKHPIEKVTYDYIFVGRIEPHKHLENAIKAVLSLPGYARLNIVGEGSQYQSLRDQYASNRIVFHGFISEEEKNRLLAQSRILILPSEREGLPTVVIEALMSHIPVVTTNYPNNGTRHFVKKEKNGLVARPNIEGIAETIMEIESQYDYFRDNCSQVKHKYNIRENSIRFLKFVFND